LCYLCVILKNMKSRTSSFRISDELQVRLEQTSRYLKRGKNWVINRALEGYLDQVGHDALAAEARRQSLVASGVVTEDEEFWRKRADTAGWK
jgi:predicted DNA-binding protein